MIAHHLPAPQRADLAKFPAAPAGSGILPARLEGTEVLFYLLMLLIVLEFLGIPTMVPIFKATRFTTLLAWFLTASLLFRVGIEGVTGTRQGKLLLFFVGFTGLSLAYAIVRTYAFAAFRTHSDYLGLFLVTLYLIDRPARIKKLAIVASLMILSLTASNVDKLMSSVRVGSFRAGVFLGDGNDFAWCLNVLLPFALFLATGKHNWFWRLVGAAGALAAVVGIIGTQSRGGTLAFAAAALFCWAFIVKRKALGVAVVVVGVVAVLFMAPPEYFQRLGTIRNYEADNSAMSRFQVWIASTKMAADYPLGVGAGNFASAYGRFYIPDAENNLMSWASNKWMSAHSVYFRLLGEYGIFGVIWLMILLAVNWRDNFAANKRLKKHPSPDAPAAEWPLFINMSIVGYAVSGVFLGGLIYPYLYLLSALTASALRQSYQQAGGVSSLANATAAPAALVLSVTERAKLMMNSRRKAS